MRRWNKKRHKTHGRFKVRLYINSVVSPLSDLACKRCIIRKHKDVFGDMKRVGIRNRSRTESCIFFGLKFQRLIDCAVQCVLVMYYEKLSFIEKCG